jgi:hypothetical protein
MHTHKPEHRMDVALRFCLQRMTESPNHKSCDELFNRTRRLCKHCQAALGIPRHPAGWAQRCVRTRLLKLLKKEAPSMT